MTSQQRDLRFDRYVNGVLMAEGVKVHAATVKEATRKAARLAYPDENPVFVLDTSFRTHD